MSGFNKPETYTETDLGKELAKLPTTSPHIVEDFITAWSDIQDLRRWMMLSGWNLQEIADKTLRADRN